MHTAAETTYRFTAITGVIVTAIGLVLVFTRTLDRIRPVGGFLAVLGAVLAVVSLLQSRRLQA